MKNITKKELDSILNEHKMWLRNDPEGERANLVRADLTVARNVPYLPMACPDEGE